MHRVDARLLAPLRQGAGGPLQQEALSLLLAPCGGEVKRTTELVVELQLIAEVHDRPRPLEERESAASETAVRSMAKTGKRQRVRTADEKERKNKLRRDARAAKAAERKAAVEETEKQAEKKQQERKERKRVLQKSYRAARKKKKRG